MQTHVLYKMGVDSREELLTGHMVASATVYMTREMFTAVTDVSIGCFTLEEPVRSSLRARCAGRTDRRLRGSFLLGCWLRHQKLSQTKHAGQQQGGRTTSPQLQSSPFIFAGSFEHLDNISGKLKSIQTHLFKWN